MRIAVADLAATDKRIGEGGVPFLRRERELIVTATNAMGATIVFVTV